MSGDLPTITLPPIAPPTNVTFPGGANISFFNRFQAGTTSLPEIQPAVAPLAPIMNTISGVTSTFDLLETLITNPPAAPSKVAAVSEKISKLTAITPQVSLPITIVGLIDAIVDTLQQSITQLEHLASEDARTEAVSAKAAELGDENLRQIAVNSKAAIQTQANNVSVSLGSANGSIGSLNTLMGVIGLSPVPDLSGLSGLSPSDTIPSLTSSVSGLLAVRSTIP